MEDHHGMHGIQKIAMAVWAVALLGCGAPLPAGPTDGGPGGSATLAPPGDEAVKGPVDGITCDTNEDLLFHIHAHLAIFVDGQQKLLPGGIGIGPPLQIASGFVVGGSCFSWLHTHDQSGVIHIESPVQRTFTLGNFFHIWGQPLSANQVGPAKGAVTAFLNGAAFTGDPSTIPLDAHNLVQLDVGKPAVAAQPYSFAPGL
ncbi:MAG TPA: hypothetical protein VII38_00380 [Polyangia bacterium]|jgi:hypothetical protein